MSSSMKYRPKHRAQSTTKTNSPISLSVFNSVFGNQFGALSAVDDPSSNSGIVMDWISEIISNKNAPEIPLRVKNALRNFEPGSEALFNQSIAHIRKEVNKKGKEILNLISSCNDNSAALNILLDWVSTTTTNLDHCCHVLNLAQFQTILIQRAYNAAFQKVIMSEHVWNLVKSSFEDGLFTIAYSQMDVLKLQHISTTLKNANMQDEVDQLILQLTSANIKQYVLTNCSKVWSIHSLDQLLNWITKELYPKISTVMLNTDSGLESRLVESAKAELTKLRIAESFDIVIDYPDSKVALEEFRECLVTVNQKTELVETFIRLCEKRLLHSGTNTIDIISTYISTIRSFLIIDHRGVLLDKVCRPIRQYLKKRDDTIQRIVFALLNTTEENQLIEVAAELRSTKNPRSVHDAERDLNWVPDPVDALPDFRKGVVEDIVESLISIFESKEGFMQEFAQVFSQELLSITNFDVREVYQNLKLLKNRFGTTEFSSLDVMIKDIYLSKKIDKKIGKSQTHASIVSHMYWPELPENKFKLPDEITTGLTKFESDFEDLKQGRKLTLLPSLGQVDLDIELNNGVVHNFKVSPDKAAIIYHFQKQTPGAEVKLAMLCMGLQMPLALVKSGLKFWVTNGVLVESGLNSYKVNE
ncbi:unnamed protein product [Ambrosiozyma monospora]|uniref:Unnamed protein product n=1 Tax=Ambrosiozyma monospora TaxID=43982 RepID=A0A9W6YSP4_AMBMO|nr:unnamed protein product [Ambrosiozyma monospora]